MSAKKITCNKCGHEFEFDIDREYVFCEFCGNKIQLAPVGESAQAAAAEDNSRFEQIAAAPAESVTAPQAAVNAAEEPLPLQNEEINPYEVQRGAAVPPVNPSAEPQNNFAQQAAAEQHTASAQFSSPEKPAPSADLSKAIACYNSRDYETANACLKLLKESEPENFEVWFCECKVLAAEKPADIKTALDSYVFAAANCKKFAPENAGVTGNLTVEFNQFLKNITDSIIAGMLYVTPYDRNVLSEYIPSVNYQPLGRVDEFYFMIMDCIKLFQEQVNPNYLTNYFLGLWDNCFFCFAHEINQCMTNDLNSSKLFQWYKSDSVNRVTNDAVYNAMCDLLYGYKNVFITLFNRTPYKDVKTNAYNRIAFINKWLLKMKRTDQYGMTYLLIAQPAERTALDQEIRNYKILLSQS